MPQASATPWTGVGDLASLGTTNLTKLAKVFEQFPGDPIADFFPSETTQNTSITIERVREGVGIAPLVEPGQTDVFTDNAQTDRMQVFPAYSRESDFVPSNIVNDLRKVGTLNEKEGKEFIARRIRRMTNRNNHLYGILRAMMLQGGIAYRDPRTGKSINVSANIPMSNLVSLPGLGQPGWANGAQSTPVTTLKNFRRRLWNIAKLEAKYIIMTSDLQEILEQNTEVLKRQEVAFLGQTGWVTFKEGKLTHIVGMEIVCVDHVYQDPTNNAVKKVWPIEKVALVSKEHPNEPGEKLGRTQFCVGEDPAGRAGLWVRSGPDTQPPAAPGRSVQLGNAGLPYMIYPEWVGILTVDTAANLRAVIDDSVTNPF